MHCGTFQPAQKQCQQCHAVMARYFCDICKLFDDYPNRDIYHCPYCGICRRGKGLGIDFFHCAKCNICLSVQQQDGTLRHGCSLVVYQTSLNSIALRVVLADHKCIERSLECNCPICHQYLFTSTKPVSFTFRSLLGRTTRLTLWCADYR